MKPNSTRSHRIAGAILIFAVVAYITIPSGRSFAGAPGDSGTALAGAASALREPGGREFPGDPILIAGTEARATRLGTLEPRGAIEFELGSVLASLYGFTRVAPHGDGGVEALGDASMTAEHDDYSGGGVEVAIGRPGGLYLEGGHVTLREPIDVLGPGDSNSEYWATSAGFGVRF